MGGSLRGVGFVAAAAAAVVAVCACGGAGAPGGDAGAAGAGAADSGDAGPLFGPPTPPLDRCASYLAACRAGTLRCASAAPGLRRDRVQRCREDCSGWELVRECTAGEDGVAACLEDQGLPGSARCTGCVCPPGARRCFAHLGGWGVAECPPSCDRWAVASPCGDDEVCEGAGGVAECVAVACDPGRAWCEDGSARRCGWNGRELTLDEACGPAGCDPQTARCAPCVPTQETCDGQDEDCDGEADEDWQIGVLCGAEGECPAGRIECAGEDRAVCDTHPGGSRDASRPETCNALDDDCDGETDEGADCGAQNE